MNIEVWIPIVLSCVMAIVAIITLARNTRKDTQEDAIQKATLSTDIGELQTKVARVEQSVASAHQRIDDLKKG